MWIVQLAFHSGEGQELSPSPQLSISAQKSTFALPLHRTFTADHQNVQVQTHRDVYFAVTGNFCSAYCHNIPT
jgi:hypothetical protein